MNRVAWILVLVLVLALMVMVGTPFFLLPMYGHMHSYGYEGIMGRWMGGGFGVFGLVLSVLLIVLLVLGTVWLVQSAAKSAGDATRRGAEGPLDILKRRYASGEITKEQFESMKRDLGL
jgi:putative membrane protein